MKTPPGLLGITLVFWGWQTGYLVVGLILGLGVEATRLPRRRYDLSLKDFSRLSDLSAVIFGVMMVYRYAATTASAARWLPMAFFPLVAAQAVSTTGAVPFGAVFWTYRKRAERLGGPQKTFDATYPYLAVTWLAASAGNMRAVWFYLGLVVTAGWALWPARRRLQSVHSWAGLLALAGVVGFIGQLWLHDLHQWVEGRAVEWFVSTGEADPYRSTTALGDVGRIKLESRVVFRVGPELGAGRTMLLREAAYDFYRPPNWFGATPAFKGLPVQADGTSWNLGPARNDGRIVSVYADLPGGQGLLKLPGDAWRVEGLPALKVEMNPYGAVKVREGPGLATYQVRINPPASLGGPPRPQDLVVPDSEKAIISETLDHLGLRGRPAKEVLDGLAAFFQLKFKYSLDLVKPEGPASPLADFLLKTRAGHCEYFATATVLMLRAAGIPSRYATGYLVTDYSPREERFLVRARHAHAWAIYYDGGGWRDLDTTPAVWPEFEAAAAPAWEPLADLWSWLGFKVAQWRWGESPSWLKYVWLLLIPAGFILGRGFWGKKAVPAVGPAALSVAESPTTGADSPFYRIEARLAGVGLARHPPETWPEWVKRVAEVGAPPTDAPTLEDLADLHQRLRFDPRGLTEVEGQALASGVENWLKEWAPSADKS